MMLKPFVLSFWLLAFTAALFTLAIDVWQGVVRLWQFVGATLLGVIGPLGTWAIVKRYPETDRVGWALMVLTGGIIAIDALLRLVGMLEA